jgi:hypothetical protein
MGGHGGLNILPQKSWNVYNWDNRLKVEEDVAKAATEQDQKDQAKTLTDLNSQYEILMLRKGYRISEEIPDGAKPIDFDTESDFSKPNQKKAKEIQPKKKTKDEEMREAAINEGCELMDCVKRAKGQWYMKSESIGLGGKEREGKRFYESVMGGDGLEMAKVQKKIKKNKEEDRAKKDRRKGRERDGKDKKAKKDRVGAGVSMEELRRERVERERREGRKVREVLGMRHPLYG